MKKTAEKIRDYVESIVNMLSAALFILLIAIGLYALLDIHAVNISAKVDKEIASLAPDDDSNVDLNQLRKINPDIKAWIRIHQTKINYPVVQAENNTKYLTQNYRNEYATAGSIFLDYRNDGFKDDFSMIYGHRMDGQEMFGGISLFEEKGYFDEHKTGVLYTEEGTYDLEISDFAIIDVNRTSIYNHDSNRNGQNVKVIKEVQSFSKNSRKTEMDQDSKIVILSTCDKDARHYRNVLLAKMTKRD